MNSISEKLTKVHEPFWIEYPIFNRVQNELEQLLEFQEQTRPENLLIISETNNGKTIIAKRFLNRHPPRVVILEEVGEKLILEVLMIQCPHVSDEKLLYFALLDSMNIPYRSTRTKQELLTKVIDALKRLHVRVLIMDELQHLLSKPARQRDILNLLKYISNEVGLSIVGVGTLEAFYVINSDRQLANRFNKTLLPKWKYNDDFINFLATYQRTIKLENDFSIITPKISRLIYDLGEGLLGEYIRIIKLLWKEAIESGDETISQETFNRINYTPPSERRDDSFAYE